MTVVFCQEFCLFVLPRTHTLYHSPSFSYTLCYPLHSPILHDSSGLVPAIVLSSYYNTLLPLDLLALNATTLFSVQKFGMSFLDSNVSRTASETSFAVERNSRSFQLPGSMELMNYAITNEFLNLQVFNVGSLSVGFVVSPVG